MVSWGALSRHGRCRRKYDTFGRNAGPRRDAATLMNHAAVKMLLMLARVASRLFHTRFTRHSHLAGVKTRLMSATRGLAVMTTTFAGYRPFAGDFDKRDRGNLLSHEAGTVTSHGIMKAQERGALFSTPGDEVRLLRQRAFSM